jgi:hypothetical protein
MAPPNLREHGIASGPSSKLGKTFDPRISQLGFFLWRHRGEIRDEIAASWAMRAALWKRAFAQAGDLFIGVRRGGHLLLCRDV